MSEFTLPPVAMNAFNSTGIGSVDEYAAFWSDDIETIKQLHGDDDTDRAVAEHLTHRCCNVPDMSPAGGEMPEARFPDTCAKELRIYVAWNDWRQDAMGISRQAASDEFDRALSDWQQTVDLRWRQTTSSRDAHCSVEFARLTGNTLAWSHLANNTCGTGFRQRYDVRRWTRQYFYLVVLHELGHLLGLPHKSGHYIMNPYIVTQLDGLTENDITRARNLGYGAPESERKPDSSIVIPDTPVFQNGSKVGVLRFHPETTNTGGGGQWDV